MKLINTFTKLTLVFLLATFGSVQAQSLSHAEVMAIKAEISVLVNEYAYHRDNKDAVAYANTFAEDGKLVIGGNAVEGRAAIQKRVEGANQESVGMHMMATGYVEVIDANNATGTHYAAVYGAAPVEGAEGQPIEITGPITQGKYTDKYTNTAEGWKLAERSFTRVYVTAK